MSWFLWDGDDLLLNLRIQPKAAKNKFAGPYGDQYKIRITAPPVDGKANACLIKFIAKSFDVPNKQVLLTHGDSSRNKRIRIRNPKKLPIDFNAV